MPKNVQTTAPLHSFHTSKVMLKILQARLQQYVDRKLPEVQAGFRRERGTRDQIANIHWIMEKAREFQKNIYFCFIDYAKAFDCVDHNILWQVLKEMGIPDHLICLLRNLCARQEATVRTGHGITDWFKIEKGVQQGCILSPCLFNLYAEHIMRKAGLDESPVGIKIAGRNNNLRYADDTTLMAESEEGPKSLLMRVKEESVKVGLKLNIKKTKIMASGPLTSWKIVGEEMEVVTDFIFLGSKITADGDCSQEIKRRLLLGRKTMANLDSILKSRDITLPTKVCIAKAMVFPVAMYGCESWTIRKAERQRIEAFELWCWKRVLRVPWTTRRSNRSVLEEINPDCSLEGQILKMKLKYFGDLMRRKDSLEKSLMLGTIDGKRRRGRQRMRWLDGVTEAVGVSLAPTEAPLHPLLAEMHSDSIILRDDFDSYQLQGLNPAMWYECSNCDVGDQCGVIMHGSAVTFCEPYGPRELTTNGLNTTTASVLQFSIGSGSCRFSYSDPIIIVSYSKNNSADWIQLEKIRAPSNVSTIIHILYLPEEAKGENIQFQWKQEYVHAGDVYEACWALDNILIINAAHRQIILEDNLDPVDTGNWLFFPGATIKEAVVQLVLKKASLDPEMATNYRPVANIPFLGEVLEQVVAGQLQALLEETDYLDPFQSGFRPGYGTESALVTLYDDLCRERARGSASLLVFLDLTAAFDTIDHGILLDRLAGLGVRSTALQWFCSYLNGQFQKVMGWMRANKLKLNPDKTEVLLVGGSGFGEGGFDLVLIGVALPLRDKVCSLGVLLDSELSLEAQVTAVVRSAFFQLQLIHQLHPYLEDDCLAMVTHALVTSRLDFCNTLYVGLPLKTVRILQLVQNRAARLLTGTGRYVHMTPVLRQLHWLPIEVRAQFKVLVITYKTLNGLGPGYLKERLHPYMPGLPLRSAGEALLWEPSVKNIRRVSTWREGFLCGGTQSMECTPQRGLPGTVVICFSAPGKDLFIQTLF
ncbi:Reelin [Varanus komodoensis]|nr:Reelin [Varanus komodoensis]